MDKYPIIDHLSTINNTPKPNEAMVEKLKELAKKNRDNDCPTLGLKVIDKDDFDKSSHTFSDLLREHFKGVREAIANKLEEIRLRK